MLKPVLVESHLPERAVHGAAVRRGGKPIRRKGRRCDCRHGLPAWPRASAPAVPPSRADRRCRRPKCRKARRSISAGGAPCIGWRARKGPSASRRNGGARRPARPTRDYFRVEDDGGPPLLALPARASTAPPAPAALVHAWAFRMNAMPGRLCRVRRAVEFLLPARRLQAGGAGRSPPSCSALPASGLADRNTVAGVVRAWQQAKVDRLAYHPGCRLVFSRRHARHARLSAGPQGLGPSVPHADPGQYARAKRARPISVSSDLLEWGDLPVARRPARSCRRRPRTRWPSCAGLKDRFGRRAQAGGVAALCAATTATGSSRRPRWPLPRRHAADGDQRRALPCGRAAAAAGRADRDPPQRAGRRGRLRAGGECRTPSEAAGARWRGCSAATRRRLPRRCALPQSLDFSLQRAQAQLSRRADRIRAAAAGRAGEADLGGRRATAIPTACPKRSKRCIRHELAIVAQLNYARYFLTVHDIVKFARSQEDPLPGARLRRQFGDLLLPRHHRCRTRHHGSLLFERFISTERDEPPDIDVDFEHERRDEVIAYIYEKYSEKRTALAAAVVSYRGRSALREVAKAMGLSDDVSSALSGSIWGWSSSELGEKEAKCRRPRQDRSADAGM